jgi:NADH-quinone oxidoreductase subunit J
VDLVVFWITAPVSVGAAVLMLLQRNAVHAALLLVLNQFTLAVFFVLLDAHFLAAVQVIVYAGAIMVLFLFVIMLLGVDRNEILRERLRAQRPLAVFLGVLLVAELVLAVRLGVGLLDGPVPELARTGSNVEAVGQALFTHYVFPFEVTSILLIVAAVAAMVLARRRARGITEEELPEPAPAGPGEPGAIEPQAYREPVS